MAVKLSASRAGHSLLHRKIPGTHFCQRLSQPQGTVRLQGHDDLIGNRNRDLPACSTVPQRTAIPRAGGP
jgi:hypothetical protein